MINSIEEYKERYKLYKEASDKYYRGNPIMTDEEFDKLNREIEEYYNRNKEELDKLGLKPILGDDRSGFKTYRHSYPMLSLQDAFTIEEVKDRLKSIEEYMSSIELAMMYKYDGLPVSLVYEDGKLKHAVTRGDGNEGDDVIANVLHIQNVKRVLPKGINFTVRGEVILPYKGMEKVNEYRVRNNEQPLSNPRNGAVGLLKKETVIKEQLKHLIFKPWGIFKPLDNSTFVEDMWILQDLGFNIDTPILIEGASINDVINDIENVYKDLHSKRDKLSYMVDGTVIRVNDNNTFMKLGVTSKYFRGAFAFKFPHIEHKTTIRDIIWQVGRTGVVTPKAKVDTVNIDGVNVTYVTLHNPSYIKEIGLSIGDEVGVIRSGDVIPKITKIYKKSNNPIIKPIKKCPSCDNELVLEEKFLYCTNPNCKDKVLEKLSFSISKSALNIKGFSRANLEKLYDAGKVKTTSDIFKLSRYDIKEVIGGKTALNIYMAIQEARYTDMYRWLVAIQIPNVGSSLAKKIIEYYDGNLSKISLDTLTDIDGIDDKTALSIIDFIYEDKDWKELANELDFKPLEKKEFKGKVCITGKFDKPRDKIIDILNSKGYEVVNSVSKNIDILLIGDKPSNSKVEKAKKLNIKIIETYEDL